MSLEHLSLDLSSVSYSVWFSQTECLKPFKDVLTLLPSKTRQNFKRVPFSLGVKKISSFHHSPPSFSKIIKITCHFMGLYTRHIAASPQIPHFQRIYIIL